MKETITLICLFFCTTLLTSQNTFLSDWHLGASYYGNNLWNPGAQVTGQKVFWERMKTKIKKDESTTVSYEQYVLDANLAFYYDNPTHLAIINNYEVKYRKVQAKGRYISYGAGIGYMRTFLPETLKVDPNGNVAKVNLPGYWYLTPGFVVGIGRLWKRNGTRPWRLQLHGIIQLNYNSGSNTLLNIEYGYVFGYSSKEKQSHENY